MLKPSPQYILIIEDNQQISELICLYLQETFSSIYCTHVTSFKEAYPLLRDLFFDLIILDLQLPDSNDIYIVSKVANLAFPTPIIVISGSFEEEFCIEALSLGAQEYVMKDIDLKQHLIQAIQHVWEVDNKKQDKFFHLKKK